MAPQVIPDDKLGTYDWVHVGTPWTNAAVKEEIKKSKDLVLMTHLASKRSLSIRMLESISLQMTRFRLAAVMIYRVGSERVGSARCDLCTKGNGVFQKCIAVSGVKQGNIQDFSVARGSCANCVYKSAGNNCTLNPQFTAGGPKHSTRKRNSTTVLESTPSKRPVTAGKSLPGFVNVSNGTILGQLTGSLPTNSKKGPKAWIKVPNAVIAAQVWENPDNLESLGIDLIATARQHKLEAEAETNDDEEIDPED